VQGAVCRPDWLVEEEQAIAPLADASLPDLRSAFGLDFGIDLADTSRGAHAYAHSSRLGTEGPEPTDSSETAMPTLTNEQIACWRHDGFMSPFPLLDARSLAEAQDGVGRFEAWLGTPINGHAEMKWRTMPHLLMPWAAKLAQDPRVLDVVSDLLGPDLLLFTG